MLDTRKFNIHESFMCHEMGIIPERKSRCDKKTKPEPITKQKIDKKQYNRKYYLLNKHNNLRPNYNNHYVCCIKCHAILQVRSLYRHHKSKFCKDLF